ncbi:MAG: L,D-transpeptidase family protein [Candidatus Omnitrophica bacterium]|nr:L,D-transpeptidase family protein [Candidatus Omnitrophota bacterium]
MKAVYWVIWGLVLSAAVVLTGCGKANDKVKAPPVASPADDMVKQAETLDGEGKKLEAKAVYQQIVAEHADYKNIETVQQSLYKINMEVLFSNTPTPQTVIHEVKVGDSLGKISKQYNVTMELIKTCNGMKDNTVRVGQKLRIWTGKFSIYVSKSQNYLMLKSDEDVLKVYVVSTGAKGSTPAGTFKIVNKIENPVWFKAGAIIPPESPDNVLGSRWMGFDIQGYGIHGTVEPDKLGQQVTAGCIRMRNDEVEELYKIIPRGTEVTIVD